MGYKHDCLVHKCSYCGVSTRKISFNGRRFICNNCLAAINIIPKGHTPYPWCYDCDGTPTKK